MKKSMFILGLLTFVGSLTAQERATGLKYDEAKMKSSMNLVEKPLGFGQNLPKSASLEKYAPTIGDQGNYGSCTGWSTTYCAATISYNVLAEKEGLPSTKDIWSFDPMFTYENIKDKSVTDCSEGTYIEDALVFFMENGAKRMVYDEAKCGWVPATFSSLWKATGAWYLWDKSDSRDTKIEAVCQMIANGKPVPFGMTVPKSFFSVGADGKFSPSNTEATYGGHAMCIVGYDDNKFGGAFRVMNSWGTGWGDKGFCWIKYDDLLYWAFNAYHFNGEIVDLDMSASGCLSGDCTNGFGLTKVAAKKGQSGFYEGFFSNGTLTKGIYYNTNPHPKDKKAGGKFIAKQIKAGAYSIYGPNGVNGFILKY